MNKPRYSQHLEDDERDEERHDDQDDTNPAQDIPHAKNVTTKTINDVDNTAKDRYSQRLEDNEQDDERHDERDTIDPRQDIRHDNNVTAKTITTQDITAKDTGAKDINGSDSYPLVGPRPEEAPDNDHSTLVQSTGADGSPVHTLNVMDKPLYSQHLEDDERDGERHDDQDATNPRQGNQHTKDITAETTTAKENKVHTRMLDRTHTGTIAKTHNGKGLNHDDSQHGADETGNGVNEDIQARDHASGHSAPNEGRDEEEHNRTRAATLERARKKYDTWKQSKILSGAGKTTDPDKIPQIVQADKSETIEDVRNQRQAEADNVKHDSTQDQEAGQGNIEDQGAGLGEMVKGKAAGQGAMIKTKTRGGVRNQVQAEGDNAKYGLDHKEDQSHEEVIGPLRKRLTKDGGLRGQEEGDASFRGARMQTKTHTGTIAKTHNGKGLIRDNNRHGANKNGTYDN